MLMVWSLGGWCLGFKVSWFRGWELFATCKGFGLLILVSVLMEGGWFCSRWMVRELFGLVA